MTTLKASGLKAFLDQAKSKGTVEESVTIAGLHLVLKNLPPSAYSEIIEATSSLTGGPEYMYEWQKEHVCRALVEVGEQDFHDVKFVSVEVENPKTKELEEVNILLHEWLKENLVDLWSRELVHVAFRKFLDICKKAEEQSTEGVEFYVQDETAEEKFRRLLNEALVASEDVPDDMKDAILKEAGLLVATSEAELAAIHEQATRFMAEKQAEVDALEEEEVAAAQPRRRPPPPEDDELEEEPEYQVPVRAPQELVEASRRQAEELMASRQPMNREAVQPRVPQTEETSVEVANPRPGRPPASQVAPPLMSRAARMAALEARAGQDGGVPLDPTLLQEGFHSLPGSEHTGVLDQPLAAPDQQAPSGNRRLPPIDGPPVAGRNRHFVDPQKNMGMGINPRNRQR